MQLGVNLWVWEAPITDDVVARRVPQAAEMGFDAVEFPLEEANSFDYGAARDLLDEHDLDAALVVAMTEDRDLLVDDPDVRANGREYVRDAIDAADALGSEVVCGPLYSAVGRTWRLEEDERDEPLDLLAEQLTELSEYADDRGITLCVEPLNRFETSFLNTVEQSMEVMDRVDHPACALLLDTFHMNIEEKSLADAIRLAGDDIGHFHACGNDRGAPGNGTIDWDGVAAALDEVGYDEQAVIESFTPDVESIARAASIWRQFEESQDAIASDGIAFLSDLFGE
jgi:D-psicose/D-tagatose/L-ribulose 3-epimerase